MKQNCYSLRPGTILGYKGESWKVIANDTLSRRFTLRTLYPPYQRKSFNYSPGQEIDIRWSPSDRR